MLRPNVELVPTSEKRKLIKGVFFTCTALLLIGSGLAFSAAAGQKKQSLDVQQLGSLAASDHFAPYSRNPVLRPGAKGQWDAGALGSMTVLRVGDTYHMYYEAWGIRGSNDQNWRQDYGSLQIGHATSRDGLHWTKDSANPVLPKGTDGAWDREGTWDPFVLFEDGVFKMWYGGGIDDHGEWGYAVSTDGSHFVKKGQISHNLGAVEDDHVVHDEASGHYYMYYWDRRYQPSGLFLAQSPNETDFDFAHARPLKIEGLNPQTMFSFTHVIQNDGQWEMFFGKFVPPGCKGCTTGLATSPDGLHWTARNAHLLVGIDGEILHLTDDLWMMFYGRDSFMDEAGQDIRVALYRGKIFKLAETN